MEALGTVRRLRGPPATLELLIGAGEAGDRRVRDVVVPSHRQDRSFEAVKEVGGVIVFLAAPTVGQVAARDDELGIEAFDEPAETGPDPRLFAAADVKIREV